MSNFERLQSNFERIKEEYGDSSSINVLDGVWSSQVFLGKAADIAISRATGVLGLMEAVLNDEGLTLEQVQEVDEILCSIENLLENSGSSATSVLGSDRYMVMVNMFDYILPLVRRDNDEPSGTICCDVV